jgi:PadR family transcriptional regulator PadR
VSDSLGEFEVLVLTAVIAAGEDSYGMTIHREVEALVGRRRQVALGAVYTTLARLEEKGYVEPWSGSATEERRGRAKRFFKVTGVGRRVLRESFKPVVRAMQILEGVGG